MRSPTGLGRVMIVIGIVLVVAGALYWGGLAVISGIILILIALLAPIP